MVDHRRAIRLSLASGIVVLRRPDIPSLAAELKNLSETGCACRVSMQGATPEVARIWIDLFAKGLRVEAVVTRPPYVVNMQLPAEITHVDSHSLGEIQLGLCFSLSNAQREALRGALLDIAARKLKPATEYAFIQPEPPPAVPPVAQRDAKLKASRLRDALALEEGQALGFEDSETKAASPLRDAHINSVILHDPSVTALDLCHAMAVQSRLPVVDLDIADVTRPLEQMFSFLTLLRFQFVPFAMSKDLVCVAALAPLEPEIVRMLEKQAERHVLVFLSPADQIHELQTRFRPRPQRKDVRATRIRLALPVEYYFCDVRGKNLDRKIREGTTLSVGENAVMLAGPIEPEPERERMARPGLLLRVSLNPTNNPIRATARIAYSKPSSDGTQWIYGVEFLQVAPEDVHKLQELYEDSIVESFKSKSRH